MMGKREESDYDDFNDFNEKDIMPMFPEVENFITALKNLIGEV